MNISCRAYLQLEVLSTVLLLALSVVFSPLLFFFLFLVLVAQQGGFIDYFLFPFLSVVT